MAPLPVFFYVLALCWAITFSTAGTPLIALLPAVACAVVGFIIHVVGRVQDS